jgi:hypothetical protein
MPADDLTALIVRDSSEDVTKIPPQISAEPPEPAAGPIRLLDLASGRLFAFVLQTPRVGLTGRGAEGRTNMCFPQPGRQVLPQML